ncbi:MAG TPA: hypothetical protein VLF43_01165 [Candidatus Saccharimonadales bacterium]|nr:hypothetical protein [Candidatus Saccharimonadales bacterium]
MNYSNYSKDQRGISRVGLVITVALLLGVGLLAWQWQRQDKPQDQKASAASPKVAEAIDNAKCDYTDTDLCKFFAVRKVTDNYSLTSAREVDGQKSEVNVKQDGTNKYYMKVTGTGPIELISIDDTTYTKATDGTWIKQTLPKEESAKNVQSVNLALPDAVKGADPTKVSYKKVGTEDCGNETCYKYQVNDPAAQGAVTYIWFDNSEFQLRRMQSTNGNTKFNTAYTYTATTVAAPKPVREVAPTTAVSGETTSLPKTGDD